MFDFSKLGDISKMAVQAKQMQDKQDACNREQIKLLKEISNQLAQVVSLLKNKN